MPHFAKRHYQAIAEVMQTCKRDMADESVSDTTRHALDCVVRALADMFEHDNPLFKRARFEQACQPSANVRARKVAA